MKSDIEKQIEDLENHIKSTDILKDVFNIKEWSGADVIISCEMNEDIQDWLNDQPKVISPQITKPKRRAVITKFSKELSWLFYKLGGIFSGEIDYISKYDFYGLLAQSAIDYLKNNEEAKDPKGLLLAVLNTSKGFIRNETSR